MTDGSEGSTVGGDGPNKRQKLDVVDGASTDVDRDDSGRQNKKEPFKPPYISELYVGSLEGLEDEPGMSVLVS